MTPAQTADLLTLAAAYDRRTIGEADVIAWHLVLADVPFDDAKAAVVAHYAAETRWLMPADVRTGVRRLRGENASGIQGPGLPAAIPDADPDDVPAYLTAVREQRTRAADGEELHPRPVAAITAGVGREVPDTKADLSAVKRSGPQGVECPACQAPIGRPCRTQFRDKPRRPHPARSTAADRHGSAS